MTLAFAPERIEQWPLARLQPYARNAKMHGDDQVAKIAASMAQFGWTVPCMVADDGEGIPAVDLPRIFDRFYQADASRGGQGSGLGLSIASWIAEGHHGHISARNNDHGGATFLVELPAASGDINNVSAEPEADGADSACDATGGPASPDAST